MNANLLGSILEGKVSWSREEVLANLLLMPATERDAWLLGMGEAGFHLCVPRPTGQKPLPPRLERFDDPNRYWGAGSITPLVPYHLDSVKKEFGL